MQTAFRVVTLSYIEHAIDEIELVPADISPQPSVCLSATEGVDYFVHLATRVDGVHYI